MRIASFPVERAERNLHIGSYLAHLQDSVPNHKIICEDFFFYHEGDQALPQAAQRSCGVSIHGGT